jgi:HK97 family phage portal protein
MGEAGWVIERTPEGLPAEFWPIPPTWVQQIATGAKPEFVVNFNGRSRMIPMNDMIWFRDPDPANPYGRGAGIGQSLGDEIDTDEYASKFIKSTFYNRARPDIIVAIEGAPTEALKVAEERWNNALRGAERTGRAYFQSGKMTVKELQQGFKELEMSKLREWERDMFISVYGVPPELLGVLTNSNRATITDARKIFAEEVIIPRLEFLRSELQLWVEREFDARIVIDYDNPHPDDLMQKLEIAKVAPWAIEVAEWRAMMGLESRGKGDNVQYVPLNLISQPAPIPEQGEEDLIEELDELHDEADADELEDQARSARVSKAAGGVEIVLDALKPERLKAKLNPLFTDQVETWGNAALSDVGATSVSFNMLNPMVTRYFAKLGENIKGVNDTTQGLVRLTLVDAIERGENPRVTARALRKQFAEFDKTRALTIARAETHSAANFATNEAYRQTGGLVAGKEWITQFINSRDEHEAADGQKVAVDQPFKVGGEDLQYPGDPSGSAGNVINCRCTVVGVTDPSELNAAFTVEQRQAIWKVFDSKLAAFDKAAIAAVRAGFKDQLKDLLKKFDAVFA